MTTVRKKYFINIEANDTGAADSYAAGEIYPKNIEGDANGKLGLLYSVDHVFREQKIKQDHKYLDEIDYTTDHEATLTEQLKGFGYT